MKWIIEDWHGNRKFPQKNFSTQEDGQDFLLTKFESDEDLEEFFVVPE
jgi:hypothetical protein